VLGAIGQQRGHAAYACGLGLAADLLELRTAPRRVGGRDRAVGVEPSPFCCARDLGVRGDVLALAEEGLVECVLEVAQAALLGCPQAGAERQRRARLVARL
jgi:hypothetical protein